MKNTFSKTLLAFAVTTVCAFSTNTVSAATFNQFTVAPLGNHASFTADKVIGNYSEIVNFAPDGTFSASLKFEAASFVDTTGVGTQLGATRTGLLQDYNLYALYNAKGTFSTSGGVTTFKMTPNSGMLNMFIDANKDTVFTAGDTGFMLSGNTNDIELASGYALKGKGQLFGDSDSCGPAVGIGCGLVSSTTEFNLTDEGKKFFVAPAPFYNLSFQSGQLDNFDPTGRQTLTGSLDVVFLNAAKVPEPASIALLGLGLIGLGLSRGRKSAKSKNA